MRLPRIKGPSPALVVSSIALVVAMGGTSYAAMSIGSQDVRNGSLTGADIKNESLGGIDVRDGSLKGKDFQAGQLPAGPAGPPGATGAVGATGPAGAGRWLLVNAAGEIVAQSGGFEMDAAYPVLPNTAAPGAPSNALRANGNLYIETNEPLGNNGIVATISLQNQVDQNGDAIMNGRAGADLNFEFGGEISAAQCATTGFVACAPPGTNEPEYFVVSPRNSDGTVTTDTTRKRFYVIITGDSTDFVAPPTTP